ncbi:MAG: hypothetical protein IT261_14665, partial [Saprospiraceae bacterium]|nr:hypothetical protein [Saprospiraceae bacterium]
EVLLTDNFQPDLIFWGLRLGEPVTAFTSLLMAFMCFYAWRRLGKTTSIIAEPEYFRFFFLLMAISAFLGAVVGHLFLYMLPFAFKIPGWILGMAAMAALVQASIWRTNGVLNGQWGYKISMLNKITLVAGAMWLVVSLWFPVVEFHAAIGLLGMVLPLEYLMYRRNADVSSRYMLTGIGLLVIAVLFHIGKVSLSVWFSFFDIAHLIMCGAFWCFMLGAETGVISSQRIAVRV